MSPTLTTPAHAECSLHLRPRAVAGGREYFRRLGALAPADEEGRFHHSTLFGVRTAGVGPLKHHQVPWRTAAPSHTAFRGLRVNVVEPK